MCLGPSAVLVLLKSETKLAAIMCLLQKEAQQRACAHTNTRHMSRAHAHARGRHVHLGKPGPLPACSFGAICLTTGPSQLQCLPIQDFWILTILYERLL